MSIMYKLTRQEVADKLKISTRSVDRYIKAGKLRSKKEGKIVYVNDDDINNLSSWWINKQEVIVETVANEKNNTNFEAREDTMKYEKNVKEVSLNNENSNQILWTIYKDLKEDIQKKDEIIQVLSIRLWQAEEIAKNSISLMEYKKSQFLLEESKWYLNNKVEELTKGKEKLEKDLKYEKNSNILLIIFVILLLIIAWTIWFMKI